MQPRQNRTCLTSVAPILTRGANERRLRLASLLAGQVVRQWLRENMLGSRAARFFFLEWTSRQPRTIPLHSPTPYVHGEFVQLTHTALRASWPVVLSTSSSGSSRTTSTVNWFTHKSLPTTQFIKCLKGCWRIAIVVREVFWHLADSNGLVYVTYELPTARGGCLDPPRVSSSPGSSFSDETGEIKIRLRVAKSGTPYLGT